MGNIRIQRNVYGFIVSQVKLKLHLVNLSKEMQDRNSTETITLHKLGSGA